MRQVGWVVRAALWSVAAFGLQTAAWADGAWQPQRAVKVVVANGAGSAPDLLARQVGHVVSQHWSHAVVVENKGAAGGVSAIDAVVKSHADGHALLVAGDSAITIMPNVQHKLPYDVKNDLVPVTKLGQSDFVIVARADRGFQNLKDLVAAAKAKPGSISYASSGTGGAQHLGMEQLKQRAGFLPPTFLTVVAHKGCRTCCQAKWT